MRLIPTQPPSLPRRDRLAHKGDFGRAHIIAGSVGYTGAPVLAALGAVRGGAGLTSLSVPGQVWPVAAGKLLSPMPAPLPDPGFLTSESLTLLLERCAQADGVLLGPGLGSRPETLEAARELVVRLQAPLVLDADGINALAGHIDSLDSRRGRVTLLTPHAGEFARLLGRGVRDRAQDAAQFAREFGCALVLKGHETLTAYPDGQVYVNPTGNPGMAKGGSGDVLAGLTLAFLVQGLPAQWAVYLHGLAGDLAAQALGEYAMAPGDLLRYLPAAIRAAEQQ